ncbi:MarR family winged helix-turn-helix transcriptional regulator [Nonomuraea jiangxiensis]|uniref:DNA-binding transcriptional regulator, MarR family n=1 Tax=Nonomuraea jiangxiensis TaxID=633440 RepID=A0A1G9TCG3_9ACTN|nr:MarR family transcriptional regulator [Nonomuraea jiangxiensis]SDM45282.1 DNA-binding transcriptional regulator, MarR family [Nonomuraea jiangxiensis]
MTENPKSPFELILGGGSLLVQVGRELNTETERRLAPLGLTAQQAALLLHAARGDSTPSLLKSRLGTDTAGMTRLLDRLQAKGLLRRVGHPQDRRSIVIELTDAGRALVPSLPPVFGGISHQVFAGFSPEEVAQVTDMLRRIMNNLAGGS